MASKIGMKCVAALHQLHISDRNWIKISPVVRLHLRVNNTTKVKINTNSADSLFPWAFTWCSHNINSQGTVKLLAFKSEVVKSHIKFTRQQKSPWQIYDGCKNDIAPLAGCSHSLKMCKVQELLAQLWLQ